MRRAGGYLAAIAERTLLAPRSIVARRVQDDPNALPALGPQHEERGARTPLGHARSAPGSRAPSAQPPPFAPSAPAVESAPVAETAHAANAASADALPSAGTPLAAGAPRSFERPVPSAAASTVRDAARERDDVRERDDAPERAAEPASPAGHAEIDRPHSLPVFGRSAVAASSDNPAAAPETAAQQRFEPRDAVVVSRAASPDETGAKRAHATDALRETPASPAGARAPAPASAPPLPYAIALADAREPGGARPPGAQPPAAESARRPDVRIGTVEVRVSPPAAPPSTPPRPARTEPLARDPAGAFGLRES